MIPQSPHCAATFNWLCVHRRPKRSATVERQREVCAGSNPRSSAANVPSSGRSRRAAKGRNSPSILLASGRVNVTGQAARLFGGSRRWHNRAIMSEIELESTLTCPHCGFVQRMVMPTDACLYFHECPNCKAMLRPKAGDCCVFCSYGSVRCPPRQAGTACC